MNVVYQSVQRVVDHARESEYLDIGTDVALLLVMFQINDRVICNGYPGIVLAHTRWGVDVKLDSGVVVADPEDLIPLPIVKIGKVQYEVVSYATVEVVDARGHHNLAKEYRSRGVIAELIVKRPGGRKHNLVLQKQDGFQHIATV